MQRAALLTLVAGLLGCQARTELVVGIVTDLDAPEGMNHVSLEVFHAQDDVLLLGQEWDLSGTPSEVYNLPGSYGLVSDDGSPIVKLLLKGVGKNFERLERRSTVQLVEGETLFLRMSLVGNCTDREDCAEGETCVEGFCSSPLVNARQLPSFSDGLINTLTCDSGIRYIDTATKQPLPFSDDAAECPVDLCRDGVCLSPLPPATERRTVTGRAINTYVVPGETSSQSEVIDLSGVTIEALVPNGAGGYRVIPGTGTVAGTFSIAEVPGGEYLLRIGTHYHAGTGSEWDLGQTRQFRRGLVPAQFSTRLTVSSLTNLESWEIQDTIRVVMPAAGNYIAVPTNLPAMETMLPTATAQISLGGNLPNMDDYEIQQFTVRTVGGQEYFAVARNLRGTNLTITQQSTGTIGGALDELAQDRSFSGTYVASAWDTASGWNGTNYTAIHPDAHEQTPPRAFIVAARDGDASAIQEASTGLLLDTLFVTHTDVEFGPLPYASTVPVTMPPTAADPQFLDVVTDPLLPITYPGATSNNALRTPFGYTERLSDHAGLIHPRMSPPQELTIDDKPAFTSGQTMSATPTLRWNRPLLGTPTSYQIQIFRVFSATGTTTDIEPDIAFLTTPNNEITIPSGILMPGELYVFYVNATSGTVSNSPSRKRFPQAFAPVVSQLFQAQ